MATYDPAGEASPEARASLSFVRDWLGEDAALRFYRGGFDELTAIEKDALYKALQAARVQAGKAPSPTLGAELPPDGGPAQIVLETFQGAAADLRAGLIETPNILRAAAVLAGALILWKLIR